MSARPRGTLVVLGKEPVPGRVKTRLCPPFTPEQAAGFYAALLEDALAETARTAAALGLLPRLALHPAEACARVARGVPPGVGVVAQRGASLGERMEWAASEAAAGCAGPVLLRGSDVPLLGEAEVREALAALEAADLALAPGPDGGYGLVALRRPAPGLFAHAMSTGSVLRDTLRNARARGLRAVKLRECFDIDTARDLGRLARARAAGARALAPRSLSFLYARALWPPDASG